jgi:excisionase family DNA binding protein
MLTAREVADYLGLRENWVYDHAMTGELPSYKIGGSRRFRRSEVERWL